MKQTLFDTRERANELLKEAFEVWHRSDYAEALEGLENDPVFRLLITALAYQENELESNIEFLRQEIYDEFASIFTPFETGHAIPASVVVSTSPKENYTETTISADSEFRISDKYTFLPLFNSRIVNTSISEIERLDGRRWKVKLKFDRSINDLKGFCFAIKASNYRSLSVEIKRQKIQLIRPWNFSELPFTKYFDTDSLLYNRGEYYGVSMLPMDLFVRQNIRMYWINSNLSVPVNEESTDLDLIFEFKGISQDFIFDESKIALNTVFLVNANLHETTLSSKEPISRIAGFSNENRDNDSQQFLHLIKPSDNLIYAKTELEVRKVTGDRFNQGTLIRLLNTILNKYKTDFYAFRDLDELKSDRIIFNLQENLNKLIKSVQKDRIRNYSGVYLILHDKTKLKDPDFSLTVKYLTTAGAAINGVLFGSDSLQSPDNLDEKATKKISVPTEGIDEVNSERVSQALLKYYLLTGDRIVTPADIKLFCKTELQRLYALSEDKINEIRVDHRPTQDNYGTGYEICVDIFLKGSPMLKRSISNKTALMEMVLQKMMEVRSTGIYPIRVNILIQE